MHLFYALNYCQGNCAELLSSDCGPSIHMEEGVGNEGRNSNSLGEDRSEDDLLTNLKSDKVDKEYQWSRLGTKIRDEVGFPRNSSVESQDGLVSRVSLEDHVSRHLGHESLQEGKRWPRESGSPSKGVGKRNSYHDDETVQVDGSKLSHLGKSSSQSTGGHEEFHVRSRSWSVDRARARSRSQSIREEEVHSKKRHFNDLDASLDADKSKSMYDSEDERIVRRNWDGRHSSRDLMRNEERERSMSYRRSHREDSHRSRDAQERERSRDREMDTDLRREKERERIRDSEMDRAHRREKERERSRERERERDMKRDVEQDRSREREMDRDRRREKERDRIKDTEVDRDWKREKEMDRRRASERDRDRYREREKDRHMIRGESERERERERRDDRNRNKDRADREKYERVTGAYDNGDIYKHSRSSRHDEKEHNLDRKRTTDSAKLPSSRNDSLEGNRDKSKR